MKVRKLLMLIASIGLVFGLMTGCGGGGSDDDVVAPLPTASPEAGLKPEKVNEFVGNIADELGCTYTEIALSQSAQKNIELSLETVGLIKKVIASGKNVKDVASTQPGTCGGSVTMPDDLLSTMTGTIVFTNYCISAEEIGSQTTINGSVALATDEVAGTITASTPTPLTIVSSSPDTGNPVNVTIDLVNGVLTINEDETMKITVTALTITDNVTGKVYSITNFTVDIGEELLTFSGTFNNPEVTGAVDVVGSFNMTTGEGTITVTDQDGVEVILSTTATEGIFDVSFDGAPLGTMDCSDVAVPELPEI